jgi:predicted nucleic acid-binding protein
MADLIVSNTGPLISLEKLTGGYELFAKLFDRILIPPVVLQEVSEGMVGPEHYLRNYGIEALIEVRPISAATRPLELERLHQGEAEAIQLAMELGLPLLIEETAGRQIASSLGLKISGTAGQILRAYRQQILASDEAKEMLSQLLHAGRINRKMHAALTGSITS